MRFPQIISLFVTALLGAGMVDARPHLYDHLQRSDIRLASAYINNRPADETITKRFPTTTTAEEDDDDEEVHHRIDITDREYLESRAQAAQHKRQSHYKFRIGNGKPVRRELERRADTEDEILPAAALPIRKRSPLGMRVLARAE